MAKETLGIDALVDLAVDAIAVSRDLKTALADGVQLTDSFVVINNFGRLQNIGKNAKAAWAEIKDLDGRESEQAAMEIAVRARLDSDADVVWRKVGQAFRLAARTHRQVDNTLELVEDWKEFFAEVA